MTDDFSSWSVCLEMKKVAKPWDQLMEREADTMRTGWPPGLRMPGARDLPQGSGVL